MSKQSSTTSINPVSQLVSPQLQQLIFSETGLLLIVMLGCLIALKFLDNTKKVKLARAKFGGRRERAAARKLACQQIRARKLNEAALYIGSPRGSGFKVVDGKRTTYLPEDPATTYIPFANEHIFVFGRPGAGKTFSVIDPLVRSAIDQGFPVFYYDLKGHEDPAPSSKVVGYAHKRGYKISIFAPGYPETCVCNPLDFLGHSHDSEMAYQLADVLTQNFKLNDSASSNNDFFTKTGNNLVQAILLLAKACAYPDIAMCHKLLALPNLIERLKAADLDEYTRVAFDDFLSSAGSPETSASIATTASLLFRRFMSPQVLTAFCGKTTLPLDVEGRNLIVFKMDPQKLSVVGPLLAATINLMIVRNLFRSRQTPLVFSGDEIPSIYLPFLVRGLNWLRSSGFIGILASQGKGYLEETYGEKTVDGILGACATQIICDLNDQKTAEYYCKQLGNENLAYKQKSRSKGKNSASTSLSEHQQTRPLIEIQQLQQLPKGKCIIINPGYGNKKETKIPIIETIKIRQRDQIQVQESIAMWSSIKAELIKGNKTTPFEEIGLKQREQEAKLLLQLPQEREVISDLLTELKVNN